LLFQAENIGNNRERWNKAIKLGNIQLKLDQLYAETNIFLAAPKRNQDALKEQYICLK